MNTPVKALLLSAALLAGACAAQNYDYSQGYIFAQPYIESVPLTQVSGVLDKPEVLTPYLDWEWADEVISHSAVTRKGDQLMVHFANGKALTLKDFTAQPSAEHDGDSQRFVYLTSTPKYHIIGVLFAHDQPAFLVLEQNGAGRFFVDTHQ